MLVGLDNLKKALEEFRDEVVRNTKQNLVRQNKVSTGRLLDSVEGLPVKVTKNSLQFNIQMEEYGQYQDKGVSGILRKYNTPYSYRDKMPPSRALDGWTVRRGIAPRDESGRFIPRRSLTYAIAKSIYEKGIRPSLFFTTAFQNSFRKVPGKIQKAFALDAEEFIDFINRQNFSNGDSNRG